MVTISYQGERDKGVVGGNFAITNWTEDFQMNCNGAADAELADVLEADGYERFTSASV